jgi:hypothetical protein
VFFNTLGLTVHKFLYALRKIFLVEWEGTNALTLSLLANNEMAASQSVFEWTKQLIVRRSRIRNMRRMLRHLEIQLAEAFNSVGCSRTSHVSYLSRQLFMINCIRELVNWLGTNERRTFINVI